MAFAAVLVIYIALAVMGVWDFSYVAVFMAVLLAASYFLSVRIYTRREI